MHVYKSVSKFPQDLKTQLTIFFLNHSRPLTHKNQGIPRATPIHLQMLMRTSDMWVVTILKSYMHLRGSLLNQIIVDTVKSLFAYSKVVKF